MSSSTSAHTSFRYGVTERRPGWAEVAVGLLVFVIVGFFGGAMWAQSDLDLMFVGLILTAWTGIAGLVAFAAAVALRIRKWSAFGVRPASVRWLLIGAGMGVLAFAAKGVVVIAFTALTGQNDSPQGIFALGASGGIGMAVLATVFLGILTPIGEEFLFRGVLTNALLRYGPIPGVLGSAVIFALLHGINVVFPAALVAGLVAGEVFRRSGSVWPAVMVHVVFNLPTIPIMLLVSAAP